jgi:hypothetical protein
MLSKTQMGKRDMGVDINKILYNIKKISGMACEHKSVTSPNCNFCPDCGEKIVCRWVSIKCKHCGELREAHKKESMEITPAKKFCCRCGSHEWNYEYYFESNIPPQIRKISVQQIISDRENPFGKNIDFSTEIWVEQPQNNGKRFKKSVIKAKKL